MTRNVLGFVRWWAPALIFFFFQGILAQFTGWTKIEIPKNPQQFWFHAPLVFSALIFYIIPIRKYQSGIFYKQINENIRSRLVSISGLEDDQKAYDWSKVKNIFYNIIDNDNTLQSRSTAVMFNGALWSTSSDAFTISLLFSGLSFSLAMYGIEGAERAALIYIAIAFLSLMFQIVLTRRHIELGNDQIDYIHQYHREEIRKRMSQIGN